MAKSSNPSPTRNSTQKQTIQQKKDTCTSPNTVHPYQHNSTEGLQSTKKSGARQKKPEIPIACFAIAETKKQETESAETTNSRTSTHCDEQKWQGPQKD
jgi:hypothetical protein